MTPIPSSWYLLRGLGRESRHWFTFDRQLATSTGAPVVAIDLPGTGKRRHLPCPISVEEIARGLELTVDSSATVGLIGISFGGMVALEAANFHGRRVSHLVLINSSSRLSPTTERLRPLGMLRFAQAIREADAGKREELIYRLTVNGSGGMVQARAKEAAEIATSAPVERATAVRQLLAAALYRPKPVSARCLVISSARDRVVNPACSAALAAFLRCPLLTHPTGGHDLPIEDPNWILSHVQRWVADAA